MASTFDPKAIPKCLDRLEKAKQALYEARNASTEDKLRSAFAEYLVSTGSVLHALEAGANGTPQGRQWYGGKKRFGRNDPLLRYMHQARNAEEHTLDDVQRPAPQRVRIGAPITDSPATNLTIGGMTALSIEHSKLELVPIIDQYGTRYPSPDEHLGKKLQANDPFDVSALYLDYLEALIAEAGSLP